MIRKTAKKVIHRLSAHNYRSYNWIELSSSRLRANVAYMQKLHPDQEIIPVLKANAYGHGLHQIAMLLNDADCAFVAVDGYFEAAKIRDISRHRMLVMGAIKPENVALLDTKRCSYVVQDVAGLEAFGKLKRRIRIHMELDSGMHRMGLTPEQITTYLQTLKKYPKLQLEGVMTHLADADNPKTDAYTRKQVQVFDTAVADILAQGFRPRYLHVAQTAGSTKTHSHYANAIRLGIGLYGINPLQPSDPGHAELNGLQPVLTLKSTIVKTHELQTGDQVSYNGIFTAPKAMRIGVLPLGYYEGVPRELSNRGFVSIGHRHLPIVGTVCMNHTIIDISQTTLDVGSEVVVISANRADPNSIETASLLDKNLFSYSWLAHITSALKRHVV
jgi:alanine racemase